MAEPDRGLAAVAAESAQRSHGAIGLETLTGPRDLELAKRLVAESGYNGERVVFLAPTDYPILNAECLVASDMLRKVSLNVDY